MPFPRCFPVFAAVLAFAGSSTLSARASGDEVEACASAYEQAQVLRRKGQLTDSRKKLIFCIRDVCPAFLRQDCSQWLDEVERALPSIVVDAQDSSGRDVPDATITVDGVTVQMTDGKSVTIDPGPHKLHVEVPGLLPVTQEVVVREGEQNRRIRITLSRPVSRPVPMLSYVLGGAGVIALGLGAGFGIKGLSDRSDLDERRCKPQCPSSDVQSIETSYWVADISLGVGVIALGTALWLYVARPKKTDAQPSAWLLRPARGGASLAVTF